MDCLLKISDNFYELSVVYRELYEASVGNIEKSEEDILKLYAISDELIESTVQIAIASKGE